MAAWRDGDLDVVVAGARKLGKSLGVLVELRLGETAVRTREVKGKREVEFGARFRLRLPPKVDAVGVVVHGTHRLSRSTVLGSASYSLDEVFANGRCDAVCPLLSASGAYAGEVLLLMQFSPRGQGRPPLPPGPPAAVPGVAVGTPAGYVNVKGAAPVQPALAPPVPPGFSALASPSAPSPGPPSPPTQAATYEPKIVEELQALRAGMEELKLQAGDAMAQMTSNVESLHNRVDELEDGYDSYSDDDFATDITSDDDMMDDPFGSSYPPPPPAFGPAPPSYYSPQPDSYSQCGNEDVWTKHDWAFEPGMGCGRRIRIKWIGGQQRTQEKGNTRSTGKDQWWGGYAALYNKGEKLWKVHYDDGERECLDLLDLELAGLAQWTTFGPKDVGRRVQIYWPYKESRSLLSSVNGSLKRHCNDERGRWYGGTVAEAKRHRFFKDTPDNYFVSDAAVIKYDDGDVEILDLNKQRVQYDNSAESQIAVGTPIDILWRKQMQRFGSGTRSNSDAWYKGTITNILPDEGTPGGPVVDICYTDGDTETGVDMSKQEWHVLEKVGGMW